MPEAWQLWQATTHLVAGHERGSLTVYAAFTSLGSIEVAIGTETQILLLNGKIQRTGRARPPLAAPALPSSGSHLHWEWDDGQVRHRVSRRTLNFEAKGLAVRDPCGRELFFQAPESGPVRPTPVQSLPVAPRPAPAPPPPPPGTWELAIEDSAHRQVLLHLANYGTIDEEEALSILGTPRAYRRFTVAFQNYLSLLPFSVDIDQTGDLKRYRKK